MLHENKCYPCADTPIDSRNRVLVLSDSLESVKCVDKTVEPL